MQTLRLAVRNLARHKRRTLVTGLTVLFGAFAMMFLQGMSNAIVRNIVETSALAKIGAIQVFRAGYLGAEDPLRMSFDDSAALRTRIEALPGVVGVAPRLDFDGLVSNGSDAAVFVATAIDPSLEYRVCPKRATYVASGTTSLGPYDGRSVLIGKTIADSLGARAGTTLVMQAAGPHAGVNALDVTVHGFLPLTHPSESKRLATVPLAFAQDLLRMRGRITEYVVGVSDLEQVDAVANRVRATLGSDFHVTTWRQMDPGTYDRVRMLRYILGFVAGVLCVLVATGIVNTMMMSVYERVREIGTLLAVGVRRRQISSLFLCEGISLGFLSAMLGAGLGYAILQWLGRDGIERRPPGSDVVAYYPTVSLGFMLLVVGIGVVDAACAALYPAWKASRLRPVEALRAT
jgi:putative ABC transport system permease protein